VTRSRFLAAGAAALIASAAAPASALAHGLPGKVDLPIPSYLFGWAAAIVLAVSFAGLAAGWSSPRLEDERVRPLARIPAVIEIACGSAGVVAFAALVYAGYAGSIYRRVGGTCCSLKLHRRGVGYPGGNHEFHAAFGVLSFVIVELVLGDDNLARNRNLRFFVAEHGDLHLAGIDALLDDETPVELSRGVEGSP